jgi:proteasome lid subunit RPN8/RPN11
MGRTKVRAYLTEDAFWGVVVAAVETFRKECFGLLLGHPAEDRFIVERAVVHQMASRHTSWFRPNPRAHGRMEKVLGHIGHLSVVGDFHSHPASHGEKGGYEPSPKDIERMERGQVYVIAEVNDKEKGQAWRYNSDGTLSGTIDEFYVKLSAWKRNDRNGKASIIPVECPFALGFTRTR